MNETGARLVATAVQTKLDQGRILFGMIPVQVTISIGLVAPQADTAL